MKILFTAPYHRGFFFMIAGLLRNRKIHFDIFVLLTCCFVIHVCEAQEFFRIKADFSLKEKNSDGKTVLTLGKVYFDQNSGKIIYIIRFPEKETWVMEDTSFYRVVDKKVVQRQKIPALSETSIFNICLNGKLANYGLPDFQYKIENVEKAEGMVITTWVPPSRLKKSFGKILLSQKEKRLFGMAYFSTEGVLLSKQFFKNYNNVGGVEFPLEIIQITYAGDKENYQVTTYKNVIVNDLSEGEIYNFVIDY